MKIAIVIQRYGLDIVGGAEYHAREVAEHLQKYFQVVVLTTCAVNYKTWKNELKEGTESINGVQVKRFKNKRERMINEHREIEERVFYHPHTKEDEIKWIEGQGPYCPDLIRYIEHHKDEYDRFIFFAFRYYHSYYGIKAAGEKSLLAPLAEDDPALGLEIVRSTFEGARGVIYNTPEERELILKKTGYQEKIWDVVGCGIEVPDLENISGNNEDYILYLGRIDGSKGCYKLFEYYLQAEKELDCIPKLILAGFQAIDIPTHSKIRYLGFVTEKEKLSLLKNARFLVNPSPYESLSLVILEALSCGTPILVNGECEVLKGHCLRSNAGLWYQNYGEFVECMKFLSLENSLRKKIGSNGKRYIEANYQWVQVEKKYLDLLEKISPENKRYEYQKRDRLLSFVEAVDKLKTKYDAKVVTHLTHQHSARISCICDKLEQTGISPQYLELSKVEYEAYLSKAGYNESYYRDNFLEKSLEHFICYKLLELSENDYFVDIASKQSPFADIMHSMTGCTSYMQDIMYPLGISNNRIGGDAANMPVKDKCFSGASATCSLEHFEGDSDIRFMQEMSRVLNSGGRIVICPLYMYPTDCYITDPVMAISGNVPFDAPVFCIENWGNRHARFYSPETLVRRLITPNPSMKFEILVLKNPDEFSDPIHCYCRFILIGEKI